MEIKRLFEPITINKLVIKNRIVMPAMGLAYSSDYSFNDRYRAFYRERARGGAGLLTIGPMAIDRVGSAPFMPGLFDDSYVGPLRDFIDHLHHETDVRVATQFLHMGRYTFSGLTGIQPIAPSPIPSALTHETPREMTLDDIETVKTAYAQAARRAVEAGFDFLEILACTGYLISEFLSPLTNQRTDAYGGGIHHRMRFGLEVIQEVRKAIGPDVALGIRIAGNDFMKGGHTNRESAQFAAAAEAAGVDAINVTGGWHETRIPQLTSNVPPGAFVYLARGIKKAVQVPVFASNRLGDPYVAERALRSGACDMICWARPLIADPELPNKVKEGRMDEIIPCIACNQGCFDSIFAGAPVTCILNPRAGNETRFRIEASKTPKNILVAGGGPAGMAFALTAAQRGHHIVLCEKTNRLGGQVNLACAPSGKREFGRLIGSMQARMARWGVDVHLETPLTAHRVKEKRPNLLVVASGARPARIDVPGIHKSHVVDAWDVLADKVPYIGNRVVVVGGNATGCETALFVAQMGLPDPETLAFLMIHSAEDMDVAAQLLQATGRQITVLDMASRLADNAGRTARWSLIKDLKLMGVALRPRTTLLEIQEDGVVVRTESGEEVIPADTVILAVGAVSVTDLANEMEGSDIPLITIGDAMTPRKITDAVREGFESALTI